MSDGPPGDEDVLSFEWNADPEDPGNIYFTLDEQSPEQALRVRIGGTTGVLAADEALTLLDWLGERESTLLALTGQQLLWPRIRQRRSSDETGAPRRAGRRHH